MIFGQSTAAPVVGFFILRGNQALVSSVVILPSDCAILLHARCSTLSAGSARISQGTHSRYILCLMFNCYCLRVYFTDNQGMTPVTHKDILCTYMYFHVLSHNSVCSYEYKLNT